MKTFNGTEAVRGYMCSIDWALEIGEASDGVKVYPSIDELRDDHECADECGIVEVEVKFVRQIEAQGE